MEEVKEILKNQLKKLEKAESSIEGISYAMCEIAKALVEVERAEIALGKREFGSGVKKGK